MSKFSQQIVLATGKMNPNTARVVLFVLSMALFVIAAGAPDAGGTIGMAFHKFGF